MAIWVALLSLTLNDRMDVVMLADGRDVGIGLGEGLKSWLIPKLHLERVPTRRFCKESDRRDTNQGFAGG